MVQGILEYWCKGIQLKGDQIKWKGSLGKAHPKPPECYSKSTYLELTLTGPEGLPISISWLKGF